MPIMDGYQATYYIKKNIIEHNIPIIAVTANEGEDEKKKCLDAGMDEFLPKPVCL